MVLPPSLCVLTSTPCLTNRSTVGANPETAAMPNALQPEGSRTLASAPLNNKTLTVAILFFLAANIKGVQPPASVALISAPLSISTVATPT